ncbi:MAG: cyclopropane-fatty-acyl-phospholipid synthase [Aestuariivita sp.]|nr:cyclopropane-fatty-acyl-phospholipid synthase [Aestuariivita sp.]MCY4347183.1 cyclopropane-fatty-acyl-phospholipid synthase [Aestuariivita sp.]
MWMNLMDSIARRLCKVGELGLTYPNGETRTYGSGGDLTAAMTIRTNAALRKLCIRPELALGEGYMDGSIVLDGIDELEKLLTLLLRNRRPNSFPAYLRLLNWLNYRARGLKHRNTAQSAKANVAHHYDLSDDLYRLMLDDDMQYSCAYFHQPTLDLEAAQLAKKRHIAQKLLLQKDCHVLDIGCGWGGMALTLASEFDVRVTGVTLSENQLATAQDRARERGLSDRVTFRLIDYRKLNETFDRIVSVGMLEHVGLPHYTEFFSQVANLLAPDGIALIHTIGRVCPPRVTSPWINKYIFPGGYIPSLSELMPAIESSGLWQADIEIWRRHYALTLREWRRRFASNIEQIRVWYDDRFIRMWNYYLTACILAFEEQEQAVYQLQLSHNRDSVPITRAYLYQPSPLHEWSQHTGG